MNDLHPMVFIILIFLVFVAHGNALHPLTLFPKSIPIFAVRKDAYTEKAVQSGLVHTLPPNSTLADFKRHLQCPLADPNFNYNTGMISMLRMSPPTSASIKLICAYIESHCGDWEDCLRNQKLLEAGQMKRHSRFNEMNRFSKGQLIRVINGTLFYDWPWGIDRFDKTENQNTILPLIKMTLERISDMRDSAFFVSGDQPNVHWATMMPMFSHSTAEAYADLVWPWYESWQDASRAYKRLRDLKWEFTDESYSRTEDGYRPWNEKIPKAAYYSTIFRNRQFMYDAARLHPDLFDAKFNGELLPPADMNNLQPWHPASTEVWDVPMYESATEGVVAAAQSLPSGYVMPLLNLTTKGRFNGYLAGSFKYVIVPVGAGIGLSTSARLQHILTHSGAVVLLQDTSYKYHMSAQFKPWVHYVPLSFSGAEVAEKVQWLKDHDDMAKQIAENGRNFARSYLRLEDFHCYAAAALDMLAELSAGTDATKVAFNPQPIQPFEIRFGDRAAYEFPVR